MTLDYFIPKSYREKIEGEIAACKPGVHAKWIARRQAAQELWQDHIQNFSDEFMNEINLGISVFSYKQHAKHQKNHLMYYANEHSWLERIRSRNKKIQVKIGVGDGGQCNTEIKRADRGQ
ncbi:hypothetical protein LCGC14_2132180 [marine sediment metagenome]|uniref:Uncharacterized protein n=1 Tax=marine sediment metagenome TaxID=412755 RepID=A0A0F9GX30_9ZZZZ